MDDALEDSRTGRAVEDEEDGQTRPDEDTKLLVTVWEGDELRLLFTKLDSSICKLVSPVPPSQIPTLALPLVPLLVQHLLTLAPFSSDPSLLRSITGPIVLVDAFLARWPHPAKPLTAPPLIPCSTRSAPPPVSFPPSHTFQRIDVHSMPQSDLATLANLLSDFYGNHPDSPRLDDAAAIADLKAKQRHNTFWFYRAPPVGADESVAVAPVAFLATGRATPRTVAIRMVYVSPSHRGQSIAQRMVTHVTRSHLLTANPLPLNLDELPPKEEEDEETRWGRKDEVCLFAEPENAAARRAYGKVGFGEEEGWWCTRNLEGVEAGHW
ncbi:Proteophosphoglycan [Rhodotorula toruloides ATCC 204091]|uniref:Proteophosphoglycan n=1 Tax=Rhodotorula toruloides TaxID=5286 RepID=A0A2T0AIY4_RHOTO|nr:Proteophosphoglycan [Rhodotorula toruloides ATCC 204091]PRQ77952.1 Proteophosphoglycan [Rhodotorula toruloides]